MERVKEAVLGVLLLLALAALPGEAFWKEEVRFVEERDGIRYSFFPGRTRIVEDCIPGGGSLIETYVRLDIQAQNLVEIQQWNMKPEGTEYRVQDSYDFLGEERALVDS